MIKNVERKNEEQLKTFELKFSQLSSNLPTKPQRRKDRDAVFENVNRLYYATM